MVTGRYMPLVAALFTLTVVVPAQAQHEGHVMPGDAAAAASPAEGSGTSWLPASMPMEGFHATLGTWNLMAHGELFAQYIVESGEEHRRGLQGGSINWVMAMADRPAGAGRLHLRGMFSAEPWTIGGCGYPNLLATGEICNGDGIHDRQHPHDLIVEVSARYDRPIAAGLQWQVYAGLAGEPALGPGAFQHRPSAAFNPMAPITHHWLDSTHITYGVITSGLSGKRWKAEGSIFNGREPDEDRTGIDLSRLDSFSGRFSLAPTANLTMQLSAGHLAEAEQEAGLPDRIDVDRVTASATMHRPLAGMARWSTTVAYGVNREREVLPTQTVTQSTHALMAEAAIAFTSHAVFGRLEVAGKPAHDLHVHELEDAVFTVGKAEVGYAYHLAQGRGVRLTAGGAAMASMVPAALAPRYGGRVAPGFAVFLSLTPVASSGASAHQH